jgi:hypothetical protein
MRFNRYMNEFDDGSGLDGGAGGFDEAAPEPQPWDGPLGELRETLQAAEGRFGERLTPLQQQMQSIQQALGQQTAVQVPDDKLHALEALFTSYDPKFEGVGELLRDLLTSSVHQQPLTAEGLLPLVGPQLQQQRLDLEDQLLDVTLERVAFNHNDLYEAGWGDNPKTETQKLFKQWWPRQDLATQRALQDTVQDSTGKARIANPRAYGSAMRAFDKFYRTQTSQASESAGASAARLAGAAQTRSSGRSNPAGGQLRTEEDGFASVFRKAS